MGRTLITENIIKHIITLVNMGVDVEKELKELVDEKEVELMLSEYYDELQRKILQAEYNIPCEGYVLTITNY